MKKTIVAALALFAIVGAVRAAETVATFQTLGTQNRATNPATPVSLAATFGLGTQFVRVVAMTSNVWLIFTASGQTFTANSTTGMFLPANVPEIFKVQAGGNLSVIAMHTSGGISVTELSNQ